MNFVPIANTLYVPMLTVTTLERVFISIGGLPKGSFSIMEVAYADGHKRVVFEYPSGFGTIKAYKFLDTVAAKLASMTMKEIFDNI